VVSVRRFLLLQALLIWQGGFVFYAAVVVPIGTQVLGSASLQGAITARVTDALNVFGTIGLMFVCLDLVLSRDNSRHRTVTRWWCWAVALCCQFLLVVFHHLLDSFMDPARLHVVIQPPFYPVHRAYLWASTVQWLACTMLLALTIVAWQAEDCANPGRQ
jgi:hypothetical protein